MSNKYKKCSKCPELKRGHLLKTDCPKTLESSINQKPTKQSLVSNSTNFTAGGFTISNLSSEKFSTSLSIEEVINFLAQRDIRKRTRRDMDEAAIQLKEGLPYDQPAVLIDENGNKIAGYSPKRQLRLLDRELIPDNAIEHNTITAWHRVDNTEIKGEITLGNGDITSSFESESELEEFVVISQKDAVKVFGQSALDGVLKELDREAGENIYTVTATNPQKIRDLFNEEAEYRKNIVAKFDEGIADFSNLTALNPEAENANILFANGKPIMIKVTYDRPKINWDTVMESYQGEKIDETELGGVYDMSIYPSKRHKNK